jgi:rubrerythrin
MAPSAPAAHGAARAAADSAGFVAQYEASTCRSAQRGSARIAPATRAAPSEAVPRHTIHAVGRPILPSAPVPLGSVPAGAILHMVTVVPEPRGTYLERALRPVHRWVWSDAHRCARKLLTFAATEADGGRDLSRAAELTADPLLRRLFLRHALDEQRHAELLRARGRTLLAGLGPARALSFEANWIAPGERGLDDVRVDEEHDASLLAFLHLSEKAAAGRFAVYREVIADEETREVFRRILQDEVFHMRYTRSQLERIVPERHRRHLGLARAARLWKGYLRIAAAVAGVLGALVLLAQYFLVLPIFALFAKRAARREPAGWSEPVRREGPAALESQY